MVETKIKMFNVPGIQCSRSILHILLVAEMIEAEIKMFNDLLNRHQTLLL